MPPPVAPSFTLLHRHGGVTPHITTTARLRRTRCTLQWAKENAQADEAFKALREKGDFKVGGVRCERVRCDRLCDGNVWWWLRRVGGWLPDNVTWQQRVFAHVLATPPVARPRCYQQQQQGARHALVGVASRGISAHVGAAAARRSARSAATRWRRCRGATTWCAPSAGRPGAVSATLPLFLIPTSSPLALLCVGAHLRQSELSQV